ncbi:P-loop containing nucleoside triphosphate hydrolase protein [Dioscorea alata]|uniref:P-loop containing nucleoside triphosphate hydrolase protein n=1 Tax=Dioscorea alata TaxID=55571 RepID=A0ACB7VSG1_DIOAL|nr:P-loop containing nucleoside triphosphate hydrolase protein [Dioscorea alata]
MAVEAILSSTLSLIVKLSVPHVLECLSPVWGGIDEELQKLRRALLGSSKDEAVQEWLNEHKPAVYDAEDLLDEGNSHAILIQLKSEGRLGNKLKSITRRIDGIMEEMRKFNFKVDALPLAQRTRPQTHSFIRRKIVELVISHHFDEKVAVFAIVGVGGLGKTTLAQLVYNDKRMERHFDRHIWVTAKIIHTSIGESCDHRNMELLQWKLWEVLWEKRYLLLLDDVWNENFEEEKIVNKCKGLPLAIQVMGSLMQSKIEESQWQAVLDNEIWVIPRATDKIRPELWLSYVNLPSEVKKCFAFCALFPKDSVIEVDMLVQFWIAHGFIPSQTGKDIDVEGHEIFSELIWRSLLQNVTDTSAVDMTHYYGSDNSQYKRRVCKMHDLIHDLAQFVTGDECSTLPERNEFKKISKRTRHFILNPGVEYDMSDHPRVRTALPVGTNFTGLSKLKLLRALKLHHFANVDKLLSTSIEFFHHLRYLSLSGTDIRELPESICMLVNLQTLNLNRCYDLTKLPMSMVYMNSLRHLHLNDCPELKIMPSGLSRLRCLKTLTKYIVSEKAGNKIGELKHWNLEGELGLYDLHEVKNADEAKEANMNSRQNINSLSLSWGASVENAEQVLEALKPHAALKELSLRYYPGTQFSMWIRDRQQLQNLVKINLEGCKGCEQLPPLEQLHYLEELTIDGMDGIKYIINNTTGDALSLFPSLWYLSLKEMANLEGWCVEEDRETAPPMFPCLKSLVISRCPKLTTMPPQIPTLKYLDIQESYHGTQIELMSKEKGFFKHLKSLEWLLLTRCEELALLLEDKEETRPLSSSLSASSQGDCGPPLLEGLVVSDCDALIELPKCPTSLKSLSVDNCPSIKSLCSDMGHLTALSRLDLSKCPKLESLPEGMQGLTSLQYLSIEDCPALKSFPEGLYQRLPTLKRLKISGCPKLERRCSPGGDYFHLVSSISERYINSSPRKTLLAPCL